MTRGQVTRKSASRRKLRVRDVMMTAVLALTGTALAQSMPAAGPIAPGATMPANHPPMGTTMPANHPPMGALTPMAMDPNLPVPTGTLNITIVPGSKDGTSAANDEVTVELFAQGVPVKKMELKADGQGKLTVPKIPLMPPAQTLVSIRHAGLMQQALAPELSPDNPEQSIDMKVYEPTDEKPEWSVVMQHLIVQWAQDGSGAQVTEMLSASNPSDRAWIGAKVKEGEKESRVTLTVPLPATIDELQLGGSFDEDATKFADGKLVTASALFPGRSEFRLMYTVPAKDGALELPIVAPAAVGNLIVFLPADETQVTATGLSGGEAVKMGDGKVRMYRAQNLAAGAGATLSIKGIKAAPAEAEEETPVAAAGGGMSAKNVAIGGAFLLVLGGVAMMLMKKPEPKKA